MKIFLTGITATPYAREYLSKFAITLRRDGHQVFVPHESSWQEIAEPWKTDCFDFQATNDALRQCELMVAVLDGYTVDDAVAVQIGIFYALIQSGLAPERRMIGVLHDTRIAGWSWSAGDRALTPQVRECIRSAGKVVPNFNQARSLIDSWKG
jgi:hypothetical protein